MNVKNISLTLLALYAKKVLSDCPEGIKRQGFTCCDSCIVYYTDNDGDWGVENGKWCGIQDFCKGLPTDCPSSIKNQGYACCKGCDVVYSDENGDWGVENNFWCGISQTCKNKSDPTTNASNPTPTAQATNDDDYVDPNRKVQPVVTSNYSSGVSVHDPSVVKNGNKYYIFGSHMDTAYTTDLWKFTKLYTGVNENNRMFSNLFSKSNYGAFNFVGKNSDGGYSVWAPDVMYNKRMKKWVQYFCTSSTYIKSSICYALADNIEGPYTYQNCFIFSGMDSGSVGKTNVRAITGSDNGNRYFPNNKYNNRVYPNAIDPNVFYDFNGKLWLAYGSWSGGIYILELDESTGLPKHNINNGNNIDKYYGKKLAGGNHQSIEGPYILPYKAAGYYYLFVSYGSLTSNGGYQIRLFRSKNPDGPYTDAAGKEFMGGTNSNFGVKIMGNYNIPGRSQAYMAPGHNSALLDDDGKVLLFYHTRFNDGQEYHEPRIHQMFLNKEGWLVAAPYAYTGETISKTGYSMNDMVGSYKLLFHFHSKVNGDISNLYTINLNKDFTVTGRYTGTWSYDKGTHFMTITINNVVYSGVFVRQLDEAKSVTVTAFTAIGGNNDSVWGVRF
ncbi:glycoside hydrolase family 43 protein [Piromyces sp. E2]|nr:glycoside hydrolase family 43 protein [Piromyces sp. E2]|eukprot:OUM60394.1 glycoside hydrolase family 43 protein [Piromyces sp. E2]